MKSKVFSLLALLLMAATGAWAQSTENNEVPLTKSETVENQWTMTMPKGNVLLQVEYEPGYTVTLNAEGLSEEEAKAWKIEPATTDLTKGSTVTVTYTGAKRVLGFKVVKKADAARPLAEATAEDLGKIAGADGNIYDTKDAATTAGTSAVAMIAYVGSETYHDTYKHGLAIALTDEGSKDWSSAKSTCEGKTAVSGAAWLLPSQDQWKAMFKANGGNEGDYNGLETANFNAGGTVLIGTNFWTSTEDSDNTKAKSISFPSNSTVAGFWTDPKTSPRKALAVLAF